MPPWPLADRDGERWLTCPDLSAARLPHAFSLKPSPGAPTAEPQERLRLLAAHVGLDPAPIAVPRQVHGAAVASIPAGGSPSPREADAVLILPRSAPAAVATADCVGAILLEPSSGIAAVVHAGWRGTLAGIVPAAIRAVSAASGAAARDLVLAMGPAVRGCCYVVGEEVLDPFTRLLPGESAVFARSGPRPTIDLVEANRALAVSAGLSPRRVVDAGLCTVCRPDLCWSYRAERERAGRMWTLAGPGPS